MSQPSPDRIHDLAVVTCYFCEPGELERAAAGVCAQLKLRGPERSQVLPVVAAHTSYRFTRWSGLVDERSAVLDRVQIQDHDSDVCSALQLALFEDPEGYTLEQAARRWKEYGQICTSVEARLRDALGGAVLGRAQLCWIGSDDTSDGERLDDLVSSLASQATGQELQCARQMLDYGLLWQLQPARVEQGWSQVSQVLASRQEREISDRINLEFLFGYRFLHAEVYRCMATRCVEEHNDQRQRLLIKTDDINALVSSVVELASKERPPGRSQQVDDEMRLDLFRGLSRTSHEFSTQVSHAAERSNTLSVNAENFRQHVLKAWGGDESEQGGLYADSSHYNMMVEQIRWDLNHYDQIAKRLTMATTLLQTSVQLRQGQLTARLLEEQLDEADKEERRTLILTIIALLLALGDIMAGSLGVLPDAWQTPVRWISLATGIILALVMMGILVVLIARWARKPRHRAQKDNPDRQRAEP